MNTADPTIVPIPTSLNAIKTPIIDVNNSGAEPPAAMNVAPATSSEIPIDVNKEIQRNYFQITYSTNPFKKSDQIIVLLERFFKINKNSYLNNSSQSEYELII